MNADALMLLIPDDGIEVDALHLLVSEAFPDVTGIDLHRALIRLDFRGLASEDDDLIVRRTAPTQP